MRRKLKKNEQNRGLNDKKAYEDQFMAFVSTTFCQFYGGDLSHTLAHLEFSSSMLGRFWHTLDLKKEGKGKVGKHKGTMGSTTTVGLLCRYQVACMVSLLVLACMWFLGYELSLAWRNT